MQVDVFAFKQGKKSVILQFFIVFAVIMCYYFADTGTVCISSEEWQGRICLSFVSCYSFTTCDKSGRKVTKLTTSYYFWRIKL